MNRILPYLFLFLSLPALAQPSSGVPGLLDLQGQLRTENGQPVNKTVTLKVSLYDASTGGNLLYSEDLSLVPVVGGRFSVHLGSASPLPADVFVTRATVFVGIGVDGSPELPRQQLVPVAYAFKAGFAAKAAGADVASGLDCQGCVTGTRIADDAVTGNKIVDGSIGTSELSGGAVTASKLGEPCSQGEILKKKPGGWACAADDNSTYSGADFALSNQVCGAGQLAKGFGADGLLVCGKDEGTTYAAGNGLALDGTTFSIKFDVTDARYVNEAQANAVTSLMIVDGTVGTDDLAGGAVTTSKVADGAITAAKLGEACKTGEILKKTDSGWACGVDGGNTYSGADFAISGQTCAAGTVAKGIGSDGTLACVTDETGKIVAGPGLVLDGSKLSLPLTCATGNVLKWNGVTGAWECNPDLNNQYAAGTGLKLDAATFSVDQSVVTGWAKAACFDTNDEVLAVVAAGGYLNKSDKLVESQMPANGLNEISNGLISDQFVDVVASLTTPVKIKDNNPIGVSDEIVFPDIGIAENLTINVDITTSNITQDKVYLYDPNNVEYVLHLPTYDPNSKATSLKTSFPVPTAPVSGNLASWIGKNPVGTWRLKVIDTTFLNNEFDGQITSWSITLQTLSTKKIQVDGDAYFNKNVYMAKDLTVNGMTTLKGGLTVTGSVTATIGGTISFTNAEGTAPFTVASTTKVDKLNADLLDGYNSSNFMGGMTYTHWGATTCGTGWSAVSTGTSVMVIERQNWGRAGDVLCYEGAGNTEGSAGLAWSWQTSCSHQGSRTCAVCAPDTGANRPMGQCFQKWGGTSCPTGWTAMYNGWITSAVEGNNWGYLGGTVCMDQSGLTCNWGAGGTGLDYTWASAYKLDSGKACTVCCR